MYIYVAFLLLMFVLKLPPFYLFPTNNVLFVSHSAIKVLLVFVGIILFFKKKYSSILTKFPILSWFVLAFFITQSLSIIPASDISLFIKSYHNVVLSLIVFYISAQLPLVYPTFFNKYFKYFILFCGIFFICFELFSVIFQLRFIEFFSSLFQKEIVDAYLVNINRGRFSFESNIELFIPFFLIPVIISSEKKPIKNVIYIAATTIIIVLSILSNNRTRFISMLFAVLFSVLFVNKISLLKKIMSIFTILIVSVMCYFVISRIYLPIYTSTSESVIDRLDPQNYEGYKFRIDSFINSVKIGSSLPLGTGLGNYYLLSETESDRSGQKTYIKNYFAQIKYSPHNIYAQLLSETGIMGLVFFSLINIYFVYLDIKLLTDRSNTEYIYSLGMIASSWITFLTLLFNPPQTLFINGWFWFLRGSLMGHFNNKVEY